MRKLIATLIVVVFSVGILPAAAFAVNLKSLDFSALPGDKIEVRLGFDGTPPKADGYTIEKPARIAIDLPGAKNTLAKKSYSLGYGNAQSLTVLEAQGRTRLIINLSKLVEHSIRTQGDVVYVLVGGTSTPNSVVNTNTPAKSTSASNTDTGLSPKSSVAQKTGAPIKGVQGIDFKRGDDGAGNVIITLGDPHTAVDVTQSGNDIKVVLDRAGLPAMLKRRLDVVDFATPVKFVDAADENGSSIVTINATGTYDQMIYQTDDTLIISVKPTTEEALDKQKKANFQYNGDKLSLNFQDIEVRSVLQLIADFTGMNLVASDTVQGRITLRLQNVPWDQALDLVLKAKGLDKRKVGNVLMVAPAAEITQREKLELETSKQVAELAPLRNDTIRLRYAKTSDVEKVLGGCRAPASGTGGTAKTIGAGSALSSRGSCVSDTRTNTILVTDTAENLDEIRRVVALIDVPVRQVLIESRIVTASEGYSKSLGVDWYMLSDVGSNGFVGGGAGLDFDNANPLNNAAKAVSLGVPATSAMSMAYIGADTLIGLQLTALESDNKGEIVSQPRVVTADGKEATISVGQEIAYSTESDNGTNTEFKNADLSLTVTPQITPDDRIIMDINITNDQVGEVVNGEPSIDTQSVQTQARVKNGETVVLGGIFKTGTANSTSKVPLLGDVPGIGHLFRNEIKTIQKRELLIFITPKILKDDMAVE